VSGVLAHHRASVAGEAGGCVGRLLRAERHRHVTFLWCWSPPRLVQCVVPRSVATVFRAGSVVRVTGRWAPGRGRRPGCHPHELAADGVVVLSTPARHTAVHGPAALPRSAALYVRSVLVAAGQAHLDDAGFTRLPAPLVVGSAATYGATNPFRLVRAGRHAFLTVSNLTSAHEAVTAGLDRVQLLSRLFWNHHSSDRAFLTEITLLELALAGGGVAAVRSATETMIETVCLALRTQLGTLLPTAHLGLPLTGLPVVPYAEVVERARQAGLELHDRHVVPRSANEVVCRGLDVPGFWVSEPPHDTTPYYVRADGDRSVALELHLAGVGEVASGSEWIVDPAEARTATAGLDGVAAGRYRAVVDNGLPVGTAGMSIGLDRLLMHLLAARRVDEVVPSPRSSRSFRTAPPIAGPPTRGMEPPAARPRALDLRTSGGRLAALARRLWDLGFVHGVTSLLDEPWHGLLADDLPEVDYCGRRVVLVASRAPMHHRLLAECPAPVFEIGPTALGGVRWTEPRHTLDLAVVDPEPRTLYALAEEVLALLTEGTDSPGRVPRPPGRPSYLRGSVDGSGLEAVEWRVHGRRVAEAGLWVATEDEVDGALGPGDPAVDRAPLRAFLRSGPPPAGGVSIDLTATLVVSTAGDRVDHRREPTT